MIPWEPGRLSSKVTCFTREKQPGQESRLLSAEVTFLYLHGIVELFLFPLLLHSFLLFLQELLSLEVASGTVFHGVVCVLGICLREKRDSHVIVPGQFCPSHPVAASRATCKRFPISFTPQGSQTPMAFCSAPADVLLSPPMDG